MRWLSFLVFFVTVELSKASSHVFLFVPAEKKNNSVLAAGGCSTMLLDGLWTVHALLALSSFALGIQVSNDPLAAPRVFISFKGRNCLLPTYLLLFLLSAGFFNSAMCLLSLWLMTWQFCNWSDCGFEKCWRFLQRKNLQHHQTLVLHRRVDHKQIMQCSFAAPSSDLLRHCNNHQMLSDAYTVQTIKNTNNEWADAHVDHVVILLMDFGAIYMIIVLVNQIPSSFSFIFIMESLNWRHKKRWDHKQHVITPWPLCDYSLVSQACT